MVHLDTAAIIVAHDVVVKVEPDLALAAGGGHLTMGFCFWNLESKTKLDETETKLESLESGNDLLIYFEGLSDSGKSKGSGKKDC